MIATWENGCSEAARGANPERPLTHLSELTGRGLAVKATRTCSVYDCDRRIRARGWCGAHYQKWQKYGDPNSSRTPFPPPVKRGPQHYKWRGDAAGYHTAHKRVAAVRGPAKDFRCAHCTDVATDWAYDHADPNEVLGPTSALESAPYSLDAAHYMPLCRTCHRRFDLAHAGAVR